MVESGGGRSSLGWGSCLTWEFAKTTDTCFSRAKKTTKGIWGIVGPGDRGTGGSWDIRGNMKAVMKAEIHTSETGHASLSAGGSLHSAIHSEPRSILSEGLSPTRQFAFVGRIFFVQGTLPIASIFCNCVSHHHSH